MEFLKNSTVICFGISQQEVIRILQTFISIGKEANDHGILQEFQYSWRILRSSVFGVKEQDIIRILQEFLLEISKRPHNSKAADVTYGIEESTDADVCK